MSLLRQLLAFSLLLEALLIMESAFSNRAAIAADPEAEGKTIEEFLQSLSTVQGVVMRKDPFVEIGPPFEAPKAEMIVDENAPNPGAPVMERYSITEYEVVAVLLGDKYPRALLRLPKEGGRSTAKVVIVKENDKLGNRRGVIKAITAEGLMVQQAMRSKHGFVDKTEVLLKVGGSAQQQRGSLSSMGKGGG
jgi:hypothetical protein